MNLFKIHFPQGILAECVSSIIYYEGYNPGHSIDRLLPDGTVNIVLELSDEPQYIYDNNTLDKKRSYSHAWVSGMQSRYLTISADSPSMMVIQFKAGGAYPILKTPLKELDEQVIDADQVFGSEVEFMRQEILNTGGSDAKVAVAERWLLQRLFQYGDLPDRAIQYAVWATSANPSASVVKDIANETGFSQQHFINLFKKNAGLSPKKYHRIVRFNHVLREIEERKGIDWVRLSNELGYYDQAHFIRDFKEFSGFSPKRYLQERGEFLNYIPITTSESV